MVADCQHRRSVSSGESKAVHPGDLGRALLRDLSVRLDRYDIEDQVRFLLQFREQVSSLSR